MAIDIELDIPPAVAGLISRLTVVSTNLDSEMRNRARPAWAPVNVDLPADETEAWLFRATGISTQLADRSADLRALVTAYSQAVAEKRPELAQLAKWQRISPSALRHRYTPLHVQAVQELTKEDPLIDIVLEPFIAVVDSDFKGISPSLDMQLSIRSKMRSLAADAFLETFGDDAPQKLGFVRNPADERLTRPIADLGGFMVRTLKQRDPSLLGVFEEWRSRFDARAIKSDDDNAKATRVRRPAAAR